MGIQVHSTAPYRRAVLMIQSGVIGKVSRVHAWSNKNCISDGQQMNRYVLDLYPAHAMRQCGNEPDQAPW